MCSSDLSGQSYRQSFESLGFRSVEIVPRTLDLPGAIEATRASLATCRFDEDRCARGLDALRHYCREWDARNEAWSERPLHDWTSHAADALRTVTLASAREPSPCGRVEIAKQFRGGAIDLLRPSPKNLSLRFEIFRPSRQGRVLEHACD